MIDGSYKLILIEIESTAIRPPPHGTISILPLSRQASRKLRSRPTWALSLALSCEFSRLLAA